MDGERFSKGEAFAEEIISGFWIETNLFPVPLTPYPS
jgi:hypothetical protein